MSRWPIAGPPGCQQSGKQNNVVAPSDFLSMSTIGFDHNFRTFHAVLLYDSMTCRLLETRLNNNLVRTAKEKLHFSITKINFLIAVYTENYTKSINEKCRVIDC